MELQRFDQIAKLFAARRTRRAAISTGVGLAAAATLTPHLGHVAAQDATPSASDAEVPEVKTSTTPHPSADAPAKSEYLFVQPFSAGTWKPKDGEAGTFTLTLTGPAASTVYFSDRPERIFGTLPTHQFLETLGFTPDNPPNAALVARSESGEEDVVVIELFNPVYDETNGTLTYDAKLLADYSGEGLAHAAQRQSDFTLAESFAEGGLFIDDCSDTTGMCYQIINGENRRGGTITVGRCFNFDKFECELCGHGDDIHYGKVCHEAFPDHCRYDGTATGISWDCYVATCRWDDTLNDWFCDFTK